MQNLNNEIKFALKQIKENVVEVEFEFDGRCYEEYESFPEVVDEINKDRDEIEKAQETIDEIEYDYGAGYAADFLSDIESLISNEGRDKIEKAQETTIKILGCYADEGIDFEAEDALSDAGSVMSKTKLDYDYLSYASDAFAEAVAPYIQTSSRVVAENLVKSLNKNSSDKWTLGDYCNGDYINIYNKDNAEKSFAIVNGSTWFCGDKMEKGRKILTLPLTEFSVESYEYAHLQAVLRAKGKSEITKIRDEASRINPLYELIPELETSVCEAVFGNNSKELTNETSFERTL